ncbi:MAG: hypothetical protein ACRD9S_03580 [Pyrinomonadaceae bacterium]
MRAMMLLCLTLCLSVVAQAQPGPTATSESPQALVMKQNWSKERINWEGDPFGGPVETFDDLRRRMADQRRVDRARGSGNVGEAAKVEREMRSEQVIKARPPAPPRYGFLYQASVKNTSEKTIKLIDWDYVFYNNTQVETGRLKFTSEERIGPGKSKKLNAMSRKPPAPTVSIYALDKNERQGLDGQVLLVRIEYTDGTIWQLP